MMSDVGIAIGVLAVWNIVLSTCLYISTKKQDMIVDIINDLVKGERQIMYESAEELEILGLHTIIGDLEKERDELKEQAKNAIADMSDALTKATKREHAYRDKALDWCCLGYRLQPGGLPIQCSKCFRLSSDAPYCNEVIKEVDSCLKS